MTTNYQRSVVYLRLVWHCHTLCKFVDTVFSVISLIHMYLRKNVMV
ncbi:hypothetical protein PBCV1_a321aR [Paramecium bursaria Chlorella virus 1]|uniref:Uncharacterized protein n=1 Tax=Paramecium bursaria Chlorella virus 1 TaxID=10506 RepID=F8TU18_PBCV1|nr:hypothetical protein PBCV1_a321aR [Paramecium bursaria Chlorella virus 1]AEI70079.1 hypothetical protein [Paramecium bursaria Chlorella virus 1]